MLGKSGPHFFHVGAQQMIGDIQVFQPEKCQLSQNPTLFRNAGGQHPIECANPIRSDDDQLVSQVVNVANLSTAARDSKDLTLEERWSRHEG